MAALSILFFSVPNAVQAKANSGFMDFNFYYGNEKDSVMTINAFAKLPHRFSYFSLTNFFNGFDPDDHGDLDRYYTEQNLRWGLPHALPWDLTIQWNNRSGGKNDRLRTGARWRAHNTSWLAPFLKKINTVYTLNFHAVQFDFQDEYVWQMEHAYRITFTDRLYLGGFGDHTIGGVNDPAWVTEHQLGFRLIEELHIITEFRRNEYRKGKENSLGFGLEYIVKF